jgi:hypothetical protein
MSNARKSIKAASAYFHPKTGAAMSAMACPATSSMTTREGSLMPLSRATIEAVGTPMRVAAAAKAATYKLNCGVQ